MWLLTVPPLLMSTSTEYKCMCVCVCMYTYTHPCIYIYTHIHTYDWFYIQCFVTKYGSLEWINKIKRKNPRHQVVWATHLYMVVPNVCGSSVKTILHVTDLASRIFNWFLAFRKVFGPLLYPSSMKQIIFSGMTLYSLRETEHFGGNASSISSSRILPKS
jgi:hypothetical protein